MSSAELLGREHEIRLLDDLLTRSREHGEALIVRGEAGIGKSALAQEASARAKDRGMQVLTAAAVHSEAHMPFAGLHQLLRPILAGAERLPAPQRDALHAAFGMTDATAPDQFRIALAALELIAEVATSTPALLIVDDAQWLDRPTGDVLSFIARRLGSDPIAMVVTIGEGYASPLAEARLDELVLVGLDRASSATLLDAHATSLAPAVRERLLNEAEGNPLALVELPAALGAGHLSGASELPSELPLTARLERAFAARALDLPETARVVLLVAAVDDVGVLGEVLAAAGMLSGAEITAEALTTAASAGLVDIEGTELRFRHPLVRSAIRQVASDSQRRAAHAALATVLRNQSDRSVWHRAAAASGPDEGVASALEDAGIRAQRRGAVAVAVAALEQAAKLSGDQAHRGNRLLRAAELAIELGRRDLVTRLLDEADGLDLQVLDRGRLKWTRAMIDSRPLEDAERASLIGVAERASEAGDTDFALKVLWLIAWRSWWADPGDEARASVVAAAEALSTLEGDFRMPAIVAYAAPIERGRDVLERLSRLTSDAGGRAVPAHFLGSAAMVTGAFDLAARFLAAEGADRRARGQLGHLSRVLFLEAWAATYTGNLNVAGPAADEARRLAEETGQPLWAAGADIVKAILGAIQGRSDLVEALAIEAEGVARSTGVSLLPAGVQIARGLLALGIGAHAEAFRHLQRLFDPGDSAYHSIRCWAVADIVEAAVHSGHEPFARALMEEMERVAAQTPSPWLHTTMRHARPLLAGDAAEELFQTALGADSHRWPFVRARSLLAYGMWLRRQRRVAESRTPLRAARDGFDSLAAAPWSERARQELRASGETSRQRTPEAWSELTPQELQIAQMAAAGLSNREIGERLYLSHRTIGSHLYRIFPKLGVTSRAQLPKALNAMIIRLPDVAADERISRAT